MTAAIGTDMVSYFIALSDEQHRKNTAKQRETQHSWPDQVHEEGCQFFRTRWKLVESSESLWFLHGCHLRGIRLASKAPKILDFFCVSAA
jgi:hypothetical protein